jgi:hypothetical protein|tara:strand:- start:254 stop:1723 length:1470 start_codon:yes stop_codon:yes gene_type:complete
MYFKSLENQQGQNKDVIIASVPWIETEYALMAPAVLKPIVEKAGLTCLAVDINGEAQKYIQANCQNDEQIKDVANYFHEGTCNKHSEKLLLKMFLEIAEKIVSFNPKFVGLSALVYPAQKSVTWISYFIKKANPNIKIIIGGAGVIGTNFTGRSKFVDELISIKLVDYHIRGDGENALYQLLIGNVDYTGINSIDWKELSREELSKLPIPDYSDYNFNSFNHNFLGILGSRGCVRSCTYCDYIENWKTFSWRTADDILKEMVHQNKKHGVTTFKFQDALVNGNLKEFNRLIELVSQWNFENPANAFNWDGLYIFRNTTSTTEKEWDTLAKSGVTHLSVGIENLNEHIRAAMGKKFSNKSLEFHLEQAQKHNIKVSMLMIVGYINETQQNIDYAKQWLIENVRFRDTVVFSWGSTLGILENTYLLRNEKQLGIKIHGLGPHWVNESIQSTPKRRAEWAVDLYKFSKQLGYNVQTTTHSDSVIERLLNDSN